MIREILQYPDPRLREPSKAVDVINDEVKTLLADMAETMYAAPGIGLAAPQVGVNRRVIVIDIGVDSEVESSSRLYKLINPTIVERSGSFVMEEGCLSIPDIREKVERSAHVLVEALDENGRTIAIDAHDLLAVCLQHEIDHLDGVLFIDHLSQLKKQLIRSKLKKILNPE